MGKLHLYIFRHSKRYEREGHLSPLRSPLRNGETRGCKRSARQRYDTGIERKNIVIFTVPKRM